MNPRVLIMRKMAAFYDPSRTAGDSYFNTFSFSFTPAFSVGLRQNKQKRDRNLLTHLVPNLFFSFCMTPRIPGAFYHRSLLSTVTMIQAPAAMPISQVSA